MDNQFEQYVVKQFNDYFKKQLVTAFAYRYPKANYFSKQYCDVLVDSQDPCFYLAIECKSVDSTDVFYFSKFHVRKDGTHQLDVLRDFVEQTGRRGFIALKLKGKAYLLPLGYVHHAWRKKKVSLDVVNCKMNGWPLKEYITKQPIKNR